MGTSSRPDPDRLLRQLEARESAGQRGRLKVFLGYASGVGKSIRMLNEGRRRRARGEDVVVAAIQPGTESAVDGLELLPGELDVEAIRRRAPSVCLIDGLAHRNPPGSRHENRWQDVADLLASGISVITAINLQYVAEKQKQVESIRGKRTTDSVPEAFLRQADDIEVVDAPPGYCLDRPDAVSERQLSALREIALVLAAEVVDHQLDAYLKHHGIEQSFGTQERVLVCITPRSNAELMLARGRRQVDRFHGELYAAYFEQENLSAADRAVLEEKLNLARAAGAHVEMLDGDDFVASILASCEKHSVTQIYVGHSQREGLFHRFVPNAVERLIAESVGVDIRVFPNR